MDIEQTIKLIEDKALSLGISKNKLAERSGVSRYQLQNIFARRTKAPGVDNLQSLLETVGYTLSVVKINDIQNE